MRIKVMPVISFGPVVLWFALGDANRHGSPYFRLDVFVLKTGSLPTLALPGRLNLNFED